MFHQIQTKRAIRAMWTDSSLKEGHVYNHASNYLAVDYQLLLPPQGFGPEAKTRGGILGFPACIHIRNFKM